MAALPALKMGRLPPAGEPITLLRGPASPQALAAQLPAAHAVFFASGTAALTRALAVAAARKGGRSPEVLLPAYGCPDLITAAVGAGLRPRLVDLEPERPWLSLEAIEAALSDETAAIVAVNLLGIPERGVPLQRLARSAGALLVEDSAQWFPTGGARPGWFGDCMVLSFGRGKPVSLLGGGALLCDDPGLHQAIGTGAGVAAPRVSLKFALQVRAYNLLRHPLLYALIPGPPFTALGRTRYRPPRPVAPMGDDVAGLLAVNVAAAQRRPGGAEQAYRRWGDWFEAAGVTDLAVRFAGERRGLVRYPLLARDAAQCGRLWRRLDKAGLGASRMYCQPLPRVDGVPAEVRRQGPFPAAEAFAERLLTLPTHTGVGERALRLMQAVFAQERPN